VRLYKKIHVRANFYKGGEEMEFKDENIKPSQGTQKQNADDCVKIVKKLLKKNLKMRSRLVRAYSFFDEDGGINFDAYREIIGHTVDIDRNILEMAVFLEKYS
jgi:hypothetical protein